MKVLVCGGRTYGDSDAVWSYLDAIHQETPIHLIIHGGARGADSIAGQWAHARHIPVRVFRPDWANLGKRAGIVRNLRMLQDGMPDLVVAFPGGRGTGHMVRIAKDAGVKVEKIENA